MNSESVDELFSAALSGDREDDAAWKAVTKLHFTGTREVLERAVELTKSSDPRRRARGADIDTLLQLMRDSDSDVRDWATFGLGTQSDADSLAIREALFARFQNEDEDTRAEAVVGLAKRKDLRALPVVIEELERDEYGVLYEEAASYLLELNVVKPESWDGWRYVEELRARFNIVDSSGVSIQ